MRDRSAGGAAGRREVSSPGGDEVFAGRREVSSPGGVRVPAAIGEGRTAGDWGLEASSSRQADAD
ncbi:hypothetical protein [Streptomyces nondiastaticus]|uniref:Uncharacterized protein n=1 Tax=Streptomyces nondiastaticus TaxID=3154512 RepID=A0ABW6U998_9ACTN